jgi:hypothetical protein
MTRLTAAGMLVLGAASCRSPQNEGLPKSAVSGEAAADDAVDAPSACPSHLSAARRGGATPNRYVAPTEDERASLRSVVDLLVGRGAAERGHAAEKARTIGFEIVDAPEVPSAVVVREAGRNRGGGAYLIRLDSTSHLLVQAPHTFFDEGTFPVACELFQRTRARALFVNTVHRYKGAPPDEHGEHPADVAHSNVSLFQMATLGFISATPSVTVVQLHGFGAGEGRGRIVLSSGERQPQNPFLSGLQSALQEVVGEGVLRYPVDTTELGATTNVQGTAVRHAGGRFLHVEMAEPLRKNLLQDAGLRARFLDTLAVHLTKE